MPDYILSESDASFLRMLKTAWDNGELRVGVTPGRRNPRSPHVQMEFGLASATVAGVTAGATTFNTGTLNIYTFSTSTTMTPVNSSETLTFVNMSLIQCTTEHWVRVRRHSRSGNWVWDNPYEHQRKPLVRFKITTAVTTATSSFSAAVQEQWGPGLSHPSTQVTVFNLPASSGFVFKGSTGNMGIAALDNSTNFRWLQGECT